MEPESWRWFEALLACRAMRTSPPVVPRLAPLAALLAWLWAAPAVSTPLDLLPVGDPIEDELRVLDVAGPPGGAALPHLFTRPLAIGELGPLLRDATPADRLAWNRIARVLARDLGNPGEVAGVSPRLFQRTWSDEQRLDFSAALEGAGEANETNSRFLSGSGLHTRVGVQAGRWLVFSHLVTGQFEGARQFADPIVPGTDAILFTEESHIAYADSAMRWAFVFGRGRWHWGPGDEGSLVLSKTSAPLTGLTLRARLVGLRLDAIAVSATIDPAAGEQLAAHRLEWQPVDALRLGLSEAVRYKADFWRPAYVVGVIPYQLVQRMDLQDSPDSTQALRNNVVVGVDGAWRIARGTRLYGEVLIDDLHARNAATPNKFGWQLGWEGVGSIAATRLAWGSEVTRLTRFVYSSFFGRSFVAQDRPLGFPTGPDARRVRVHVDWDVAPAWQLKLAVARTDHGENRLDEPFVPGSPRVEHPERFEGVVERTREIEAGVRFWPTSGFDVGALGGYRWIDDQGHVPGARS